jgi:hypothetical protein
VSDKPAKGLLGRAVDLARKQAGTKTNIDGDSEFSSVGESPAPPVQRDILEARARKRVERAKKAYGGWSLFSVQEGKAPLHEPELSPLAPDASPAAKLAKKKP